MEKLMKYLYLHKVKRKQSSPQNLKLLQLPFQQKFKNHQSWNLCIILTHFKDDKSFIDTLAGVQQHPT